MTEHDDHEDYELDQQFITKVFEKVLQDKGAPLMQAHVTAAATGFSLDENEELVGHADQMYVLGLVANGYTIVDLSKIGDGDIPIATQLGEPTLMAGFLTREGLEALVASLSDLLTDEG